jgi:molybdate transport system substrate-binding protein
MSGRSSTRTERAARSLVAASVVFALVACKGKTTGPEPLKVAAAADLSFAFKDLGASYEKATGQPVVFEFGSTGLLEKQIAEGAPFDAFAAANVSYADDAVKSGACLADSKSLYATGRIVLFPGKGSAFTPKTVADLADARIKRIAIANPDHAPYGKAAKQAMQKAGVWDKVSSEVVFGENVQQTLQFAQTGNVDVALVALSLATVTPGDWTLVPPELHDPIDQAIVACTHGKSGADAGKRFAAFVNSPDGRAVMRKYGFLLPNESMAGAK